jgi:O-antigen/teichoic acid export membrane protein
MQLGVSKVLYLVGTLVLGHLLAPKEFGLVAIATVAITTIMAATETGMTNALVQSQVREQAHYDVAWTIGFFRGLIVCLVLLLAAPLVARLFGAERAAPMVRLMAFLPLISSAASPRMADLIRELQFSKVAPVALAAVVVEVGLSIALATRLGGAAIIVGKLAGAATATATSYVLAPHRPRFRPNYSSARQLLAFGRWLFAISITAVSSDLFIKVFIVRHLSVSDLGLFSMSDKLGELPTQATNESIGAVAFPLYARLRGDQARMQNAIRAHVIGLMFFIFPATALIIALAKPIETEVLGPSWSGISPLIVLFVLGYFFEVVVNVAIFLLQALGAGARLFVIELIQYGILIAVTILLASQFGLVGVGVARIIAAISISSAAVIAAPVMFRRTLLQAVRPATGLLLWAILAGIIARLCATLVPGTAGIVTGTFLGSVFFIGLVWVADERLRMGVRGCLALFFPILATKSGDLSLPTP